MDVDDVDVIAVLGAGNMGHGIAEVAALAGYEVTLRDINEEFVQQGYEQIEWSLEKLVEKERVTDAEAEATLDRVDAVVDLEEAVSDADVVVEAAPEKMDIKRTVYEELERYAPERTTFATNTSSLSVTELSEVSGRPGRFCGMHFFNPPVRMELVEVVAGDHTDEGTLDLVEDLATSLGKTPVRVRRDSPGFVVNRVLVPLMNEAAWLVETGEATVAEVDSTTKYGLGLPMGAFELADQVGVDVGYHVLEHLHETLGDAYEPCPLLESKVEQGALGKKTGQGFYGYEDGGAEIPTDAVRADVRRRLLAVMANEVAALVDGGVADAEAIDRAVELGARFPDGPAKMADDEGAPALVDALEERHEEAGAARYEARSYLRTLANDDAGFYGDSGECASSHETVRVEREGGVGRVVLARPHRMNTISSAMLDELERAFEELAGDDAVRAVLLTGAGDRAFSAGADVQSAAAGGIDHLSGTELSRRGHEVFGKLESCDGPVVAAIDGYCLGGGMELSMCADLRVASERAEFGQTEHELGLMPGWGATQRLPRIVGEARAKEMILTADRYDAATLESWGFLNEVVPANDLDERATALAEDLAAGPPVAQRYTKRAIHRGRDDVDAGLELESQAFGHVAGTDDLMEGVTAFMSDREPEFEGT